MINRREFIEAAAASAVPAIAGASQRKAGSAKGNPAAGAIQVVLIDERIRESRSVGARLSQRGVTPLTLRDGDVTQVWLEHIGPMWKTQPVTVGGLTARPALFCLEQLAVGCGLRVVFHAEHVVHREGRAEHRIFRGAETTGVSARELNLAGWLWPARIAEGLAAHSGQPGQGRFGLSASGLSPPMASGSQLLTSWIIAVA